MKNSLAVAIEALSWMAYAGVGERTALFKAANQIGVRRPDELRQAHKLIMETARFQNRLEHIVSNAIGENRWRSSPHGIISFLKILTYLRHVERARERELERTVELARQILGWKEIYPFEREVAGLLSGFQPRYDQQLAEFERLSLQTCHPVWFVNRLIQVFGRSFSLKILRRNMRPSPTYVRLNTLKVQGKGQRENIANQLRGSRVELIDDVWRIDGAGAATVRSRSYLSGEIVIQDLASIATGLITSPAPGATVLDLCAAPGNKTSHMAALMQNKGEIYSLDTSAKRFSHWRTEMIRTGTEIAMLLRAEARRIPLNIKADVVLVDPPCSNTGAFARNPSIKWKITPSRVNEFALKQFRILQAASEHVDRGGIIVYCTCSILPEENEQVIEAFLGKNPDFKLVPQTPFLGSPGLRGLTLCQRFHTHLHECNGYFIAKLQRID